MCLLRTNVDGGMYLLMIGDEGGMWLLMIGDEGGLNLLSVYFSLNCEFSCAQVFERPLDMEGLTKGIPCVFFCLCFLK